MKRGLAALFLVAFALCAFMFLQARRMPIVRRGAIALADYPVGAKPLRIALLTDTHMAGPDQDPERLARIVAAVDAQHPDLVLLGGDYMGEPKLFGRSYDPQEAVAPLARLHAPLGILAVLGNHDHWDAEGAIGDALARLGIPVLSNRAVQRGPLVIGGIDDGNSDHADVAATVDAVRALGGAAIYLSHGPDVFGRLPLGSVLLTGHTHCGQIALPFFGAVLVPGKHPIRYPCGRYDREGKIVIVSGGVGTSDLPFRLFAPPDFWIVTVSGRR
jgi:predicted MPP superfamily phosphohydrolase